MSVFNHKITAHDLRKKILTAPTSKQEFKEEDFFIAFTTHHQSQKTRRLPSILLLHFTYNTINNIISFFRIWYKFFQNSSSFGGTHCS